MKKTLTKFLFKQNNFTQIKTKILRNEIELYNYFFYKCIFNVLEKYAAKISFFRAAAFC